MVWKSGTFVLLVSDHPDNAQHRSVFHRTLAVDGESKQRLVAFSLLLSADDSVPQLWQDALDFVHLPVFRRLSIASIWCLYRLIIFCSIGFSSRIFFRRKLPDNYPGYLGRRILLLWNLLILIFWPNYKWYREINDSINATKIARQLFSQKLKVDNLLDKEFLC